MRLAVLGAHGTWPKPGGATSGYLLSHDGFNLWVDMGTGTLANLQRHVGLFDVGAVVISHSHPDHVTDLYAYLFARIFSPEPPPSIPLYVAPKVVERARPLLSDDTADIAFGQAFQVVEVQPGETFHMGPFTVRSAPMRHTVPTIGLRAEAGGVAVAYTADTGPADEVTDLAKGSDLLLAEASWQEDGTDRPPIHLSAREAGEAASRAGAGRLILTHIRPYLDWDLSREEAARVFEGDVAVAEEGMVLEVGG
ncbi:MAG: MBL fold metallo-hydrolase [Actinomycetota bacterium]